LTAALTILGPGVAIADPGPIAAAYGLARLLAELPVTLAAGHVMVPLARLSANHLDVTAVAAAAAANSPAWQALLGDLAAEVRHGHMLAAASMAALPRSHRAALYPLALVTPYLQSSVSQWGPRGGSHAAVQPITRVWRLLVARVTGRLATRPLSHSHVAHDPTQLGLNKFDAKPFDARRANALDDTSTKPQDAAASTTPPGHS
jgi:hypothetical protein